MSFDRPGIPTGVEITQHLNEQTLMDRLGRMEHVSTLLGRVAVGLIGGVVIVGVLVVMLMHSVTQGVEETIENRQFDTERGAVLCLNLLINPERSFRLPPICYQAGVAEHYPPEVCVDLDSPPRCAIRYEPSS